MSEDEEATFASLLARRPVFLALARKFAGPDDAEDLLQDTYERAWKSWPPHHTSNLVAWFNVIMRRLYINGWRQQQRRRAVTPRPAEPRLESMEDTLWRGLDTVGLLTALCWWCSDDVLTLLQLMPVVHRETALRSWVGEEDYEELARDLTVSPQTVGSRIYRARRAVYREKGPYDTRKYPHRGSHCPPSPAA